MDRKEVLTYVATDSFKADIIEAVMGGQKSEKLKDFLKFMSNSGRKAKVFYTGTNEEDRNVFATVEEAVKAYPGGIRAVGFYLDKDGKPDTSAQLTSEQTQELLETQK